MDVGEALLFPFQWLVSAIMVGLHDGLSALGMPAAGADVTTAVTGAREPTGGEPTGGEPIGGEPTGAAEPGGAGTAEESERDSGAVARPTPDARTAESANHPYLAAGWFALAPILIAGAVFHRRRQGLPPAR